MRTLLMLFLFVGVAGAQSKLDSTVLWPSWPPQVNWHWIWIRPLDAVDSVWADRADEDPELWDEVGDSTVAFYTGYETEAAIIRKEYPRYHWVYRERRVLFEIGLRDDGVVVWRKKE